MIVCLCHAVSDRTLRDLAGHLPAHEVIQATGAGTACGCCREMVDELLGDAEPCRSEAACSGCPNARVAA